MHTFDWQLRYRTLTIGPRPLVMGIVNVTPDSFSDGGRWSTTEAAVAHARKLVDDRADILDIGGESTRPGSLPVPTEEQLRRVLPVVEALAGRVPVPLSVDTSDAVVARRCLAAGADIINDVTGLGGDPDMVAAAREFGAGVVVMHMQGTPATMQAAPHYEDVVAEIGRYLEERLHFLTGQGISASRVALDPGFGFGKTHAHNLEILARLREFQRLSRPVCLGVSRKGLIGKVTGRETADRMAGSLAIACRAAVEGSAQIVRVHDVRETADAMRMLAAIEMRVVSG